MRKSAVASAEVQIESSGTMRPDARSRALRSRGVKIGLFCSTPMVPLTRVIGRRRALHMLFTGLPVDAATALEETTRTSVERLEAMVDEERLPSGDDLIGEIERFLREGGSESTPNN